MEMGELLQLIVLIWVAIVLIIWVIIRKVKPQILGLGNVRSIQKIDGVKLDKCDKCDQGEMIPVFKWWRYFFCIWLPPGIVYMFGKPNGYRCSYCGNEPVPTQTSEILTRISLTQHLHRTFIVVVVATWIIYAGIILTVIKYFFVDKQLIVNSINYFGG